MGVALGAVADDGDLLGLDEREVGVVIVVSLGHDFLDFSFLRCVVDVGWSASIQLQRAGVGRRYSGSDDMRFLQAPADFLLASCVLSARPPAPMAFRTLAGVMAAAHGHFAAAADFENAAFVFAEHLDEAFDLAFDAGHFDHQRLRSEVDDAGAKDFDQIEDLRAVARRGGHFDERQFAGDGRRLGDVVDVDDIFQLEQAGADAVAGLGGGLADQREAREAGSLAAAHGERVDVDVEAAEERGHAREHAGQIFNVSDECVQHKSSSLAFELLVFS